MRPPHEGRRLCYASQMMLCRGTSVLALLAAASTHRLMTFIGARTVGRTVDPAHTAACAAYHSHTPASSGRQPLSMTRRLKRSTPSARRLGRRTRRLGVRVLLRPPRLRVDAGHAHASAPAPRAQKLARRAAEVGDHLAGAAAGHTLPRPMRRRYLLLAVATVACHEPITLAFRA